MLATSSPTKAQADWRETVRELGSVVSGGFAEIHHCVGRTGKHNKVDIGHYWLIPLTDDEHRALHLNAEWLLRDISGYVMTRKEFEKWAFQKVIDQTGYVIPADVYEAIMDYHR